MGALWDSFWHMPDGLEVAAAAARLAFWKHVDDQEGQNFAQTLALGVTRKQTGLTQPAEGVGLPSVASSQALLGSISQIRGEIETAKGHYGESALSGCAPGSSSFRQAQTCLLSSTSPDALKAAAKAL